MFRECGECKECCIWPKDIAFGWEFGEGKKCKFLDSNGCSIYKLRPKCCSHYQCVWSQNLLPEEMRPDKCNFLVNLRKNEYGLYFQVVVINGKKISDDEILWFKDWAKKLNIPILFENPSLKNGEFMNDRRV